MHMRLSKRERTPLFQIELKHSELPSTQISLHCTRAFMLALARACSPHTHTHQTIKLWHCSDKKQTNNMTTCVFTSFVQTIIACKLRPRVRRSLSVCAFVRACPCHIIRLVYARQLCNFSHLPWEGCRGGVRVSVHIQVLWQAAQSFMRLGVRISNDTICGDNFSWRWNASRASFKLTFFFFFSHSLLRYFFFFFLTLQN